MTHVLNMQIEFDDRPLAAPQGIEVLWNPTDDDFLAETNGVAEEGRGFCDGGPGRSATRLYVHCAAGVHRAPMMTLAVLCSLNWQIDDAMHLIESRAGRWWILRTCMWRACDDFWNRGWKLTEVGGERLNINCRGALLARGHLG